MDNSKYTLRGFAVHALTVHHCRGVKLALEVCYKFYYYFAPYNKVFIVNYTYLEKAKHFL